MNPLKVGPSLYNLGIFCRDEADFQAECARQVDEEVNAYLTTEMPPPSAMFDYTYAELPAELIAQRNEMLGTGKAHD